MKFTTKNNLDKVICITEYQQENNWIHAYWDGFANVEAIKCWGENFIKLIEETNCPYILVDGTKSTGPWSHALDWIQSDLLPRSVALGVKFYAHVVSQNRFSEMSAKELRTKIQDQMEMLTFKTLEEAKDWLQLKQES